MENYIQGYLPIITEKLNQLHAFTVEHYEYAIIWAAAAWLLTTLFYRIRLAFSRRKIRRSEQAASEAQTALENTRQQLQQQQDELANTTAQLQQEQAITRQQGERLGLFEGLVGQHNKQAVDLLQGLAMQLDLGERPLPLTEDVKAEGLWQQLDRIVKQLADKFKAEQQAKADLQQAYQTETAKLAEKEIMLTTMRTTLDLQTGQIAGLEANIASLNSRLQHEVKGVQIPSPSYTAPSVTPSADTSAFKPANSVTNPFTAAAIAPLQVNTPEPAPAAPVNRVPESMVRPVENNLPPTPTYTPEPVVIPEVQQPVTPVSAIRSEPVFSGNENASFSLIDQENYQLGIADKPSQPVYSPEPVAIAEPEQPVVPVPATRSEPAFSSNENASFSLIDQENYQLGITDRPPQPVTNKPVIESAGGMAEKLKSLLAKKTGDSPVLNPQAARTESSGAQKLKGWLGKVTSKNK